jgi:hypothetical protein
MKNQIIKIALSMLFVAGGVNAQAQDYNGRYTNNGYVFQNVNAISGNLTKTNGTLAGRITVINTDQRWTADTIYILNNLTFVEPPGNLVIEPGTIIRGEPVTTGGSSTLDPADPGSLIICRGAKIVAAGTAESPIYFTSAGDPFVPGGTNTIPVNVNSNSFTASTEAAKYSTAAYSNGAITSFKAHDIDARWGGLTILGNASVGFGGPTGAAGNLQIGVLTTTNGGYTQNPVWTFGSTINGRLANSNNIAWTGTNNIDNGQASSAFKLEPLFFPAGVDSIRVDNGGKFTGHRPDLLATAADGSRTATKTELGSVSLVYNFGTNGIFNGSSATTSSPGSVASVAPDTATGGDDYWEITGVALKISSYSTNSTTSVVTTNYSRGLQYNVPTKKDTAPFTTAGGFSGAEVALQYKNGGTVTNNLTANSGNGWTFAYNSNSINPPTSGLDTNTMRITNSFVNIWTNATTNSLIYTNQMVAYPILRMILQPTSLYGVIVKAPAGLGALSVAPSVTISGGNATTDAQAECSVAGSVGEPSAIPLKGGIGANFIEGFQAIDGNAYGVTSSVALSGGIYGGRTDADNSGTIRFCRFSFGGYVLSPNNEINGVTYGGVGSGTVTEFVEIFNNADDDFEMFGGCNDLKYVAGIFGGDDGFDTDMGYRGNGQFMFQLQNNTRSNDGDTGRSSSNIGDNLGENDGNEDPNTIANLSYPGTEFTYFNLTAIGVGYNVKGTFPSDRSGPNFKDNAGGKILNSVYVEAPSGAIQDQATTADTSLAGRRTFGAPYVPKIASEPQGVIAYNTWSKCGGGKSSIPTIANYTNTGSALFPTTSGRTSSGGGTINQPVAVGKMTVATLSNSFVGTDVVASTGVNGRLNGVDPILYPNVAERTNGTDPRNSVAVAIGATTGLQAGVSTNRGVFFAPNNFRGAFRDFNWLKGWSLADDLGVFAQNNVEVPDVTLSRNSSGVVSYSFTGAAGIQYNVEWSQDNKNFYPVAVVVGGGSAGTISNSLNLTDITFVRVTPL